MSQREYLKECVCVCHQCLNSISVSLQRVCVYLERESVCFVSILIVYLCECTECVCVCLERECVCVVNVERERE